MTGEEKDIKLTDMQTRSNIPFSTRTSSIPQGEEENEVANVLAASFMSTLYSEK